MDFTKNDQLLDPICRVELKNVSGTLFPDLEEIYGSLSSIRLSSRQAISGSGFLATNKLSLNYPGISSDLFSKQQHLIKGLYIVRVITTTEKVFEIAPSENPMAAKINFLENQTSIEFENVSFEPFLYIGNLSEENIPFLAGSSTLASTDKLTSDEFE